MHFLMFRFKRAHLRSLAVARKLQSELGLTPARYDLLRVLGWGSGQEHQYTLWRGLGISRTSGSKMVRRLMALGLITRWRSESDRRTFVVAFTEAGVEALRRAVIFLHRSQVLRKAFELCFDKSPSDEACIAAQNLDWAVDRVARRFGDTSRNLYPSREPEDDFWDADDDGPEPDELVVGNAAAAT